MRLIRWRHPAALAALTIAAAGALFGAAAAQATDGGEHAYLPEKSDPCLSASQPEIESVRTTEAKVNFTYFDNCTFPAFSSVEIRSAGGGWSEFASERTKSKWTKRSVWLGGLRNDTRYFVRTRIDYLFSDAHTSELTFRTGGDAARDMHAWGNLAAFPADAKMSLSAVVTDTGRNVPVGIWVARPGFGQFSQELDWKGNDGQKTCDQLPDHYSKCTWPIRWKLGTDEPPRLPDYWWWKDEMDYRVRLCIKNTVYENAFDMQCTKEFTVTAGKAQQVDVGQAP
jgi:hypothetical protein